MANSLYIHIPFCRQKCPYCNFHSVPYEPGIASDYVGALLAQIEKAAKPFSTIYIGGGTPTVLGAGLLGRLLGGLSGQGRFLSEFTVEANPESLSRDTARLFLESGVNRVSVGVQSFSDSKLKKLGRIHNAEAAQSAIRLLSASGFKNISLGLMFGLCGESLDDWMLDLEKAAASGVAHISCYALTYEKGTPFFNAAQDKSAGLPEEEAVVEMYERAVDYLAQRGFRQYEISNFARDDYACSHNLNYWENGPYIGLGASAVSYINGRRQENVSDIKEYISKAASGENPVFSSEELSSSDRARETLALKIRTAEGIDREWFKGKTGLDLFEFCPKPVKELADTRLIEYKRLDGRVSGFFLTRKGFLFADSVSREFL